MPATDPDHTPAAIPANDSIESEKLGLLGHFWAFTPQAQRILFWGAVSLALTCGMRAATHFLDGPKPESQANVSGAAGGSSSSGGGGAHIWWSPAGGSIEVGSVDSGVSGGPPPLPSTEGKSIIPVDHNAQFATAGALNSGALVPIGSGSSREAYAILGLGAGSGSRMSNPAGSFSSSGSGGSASLSLHFSMSGDLNLVPTDNLAAGGLSPSFVAVPEPSICGLLAITLAGFALKRHRKPFATDQAAA